MFAARLQAGARGGDRTRTTLRSRDFKSLVSAIPPPGQLLYLKLFTYIQPACCRLRDKLLRVSALCIGDARILRVRNAGQPITWKSASTTKVFKRGKYYYSRCPVNGRDTWKRARPTHNAAEVADTPSRQHAGLTSTATSSMRPSSSLPWPRGPPLRPFLAAYNAAHRFVYFRRNALQPGFCARRRRSGHANLRGVEVKMNLIG